MVSIFYFFITTLSLLLSFVLCSSYYEDGQLSIGEAAKNIINRCNRLQQMNISNSNGVWNMKRCFFGATDKFLELDRIEINEDIFVYKWNLFCGAIFSFAYIMVTPKVYRMRKKYELTWSEQSAVIRKIANKFRQKKQSWFPNTVLFQWKQTFDLIDKMEHLQQTENAIVFNQLERQYLLARSTWLSEGTEVKKSVNCTCCSACSSLVGANWDIITNFEAYIYTFVSSRLVYEDFKHTEGNIVDDIFDVTDAFTWIDKFAFLTVKDANNNEICKSDLQEIVSRLKRLSIMCRKMFFSSFSDLLIDNNSSSADSMLEIIVSTWREVAKNVFERLLIIHEMILNDSINEHHLNEELITNIKMLISLPNLLHSFTKFFASNKYDILQVYPTILEDYSLGLEVLIRFGEYLSSVNDNPSLDGIFNVLPVSFAGSCLLKRLNEALSITGNGTTFLDSDTLSTVTNAAKNLASSEEVRNLDSLLKILKNIDAEHGNSKTLMNLVFGELADSWAIFWRSQSCTNLLTKISQLTTIPKESLLILETIMELHLNKIRSVMSTAAQVSQALLSRKGHVGKFLRRIFTFLYLSLQLKLARYQKYLSYQ